ncbi:MAG: hypothetical protein K2G16_10585 [Lachnospiraceae bacterium]|nr:hypothetical protein [Lachnospiraceae bacterium]
MGTVAQVENHVQTGEVYQASGAQKKNANYGKTIGKPELSEKAQKYYEELKKKYSNMDFVLVSKDMKEAAKAQAGSYANPHRLVVLIDEEKVERMASDENFRKQYEGIISSAAVKLPQLQKQLANKPGVKAFGMQINDGGNASFFAVVDKSLAAQRDRIKQSAAKKVEQKKADAKKKAKKAAEEKQAEKRAEKAESEKDLVTVTASSVEELLRKVDDTVYDALSDSVQTDSERLVGQNFSFRC